MIRNKNLIMTFASGNDEFFHNPTFLVWLNSVKILENVDIVIITHQMSDKVKERLIESNVEIVNADEKEVHYIYRDRHLCFYKYLNHSFIYFESTRILCELLAFFLLRFFWL